MMVMLLVVSGSSNDIGGSTSTVNSMSVAILLVGAIPAIIIVIVMHGLAPVCELLATSLSSSLTLLLLVLV
jgi:hypothetical protein